MKILILSNDEMERTVIQQVLNSNGHEILMAGTSDDAMQLLQEGNIRFMIVDRNTTDMDEKQFIKRVRDAHPPYYIYIILTASKVNETDVTTPRSGADDYLHKPIVPLDLKSRVHIGERMLGLGDNLVNAKDTLEKTAMFDPLTKMLSGNAFISISRGELERARRAQAPLSLVALEIDKFKDIAEKYSEEIADEVLILIAQAIREKSRPYDGVGRYNKNIFLIPLPGVIGQDAEKIAQRILKGILNTTISLLDGTTLDIKVSIGIASSLRVTVATDIESLIEKAREAVNLSRLDKENQVHTILI